MSYILFKSKEDDTSLVKFYRKTNGTSVENLFYIDVDGVTTPVDPPLLVSWSTSVVSVLRWGHFSDPEQITLLPEVRSCWRHWSTTCLSNPFRRQVGKVPKTLVQTFICSIKLNFLDRGYEVLLSTKVDSRKTLILDRLFFSFIHSPSKVTFVSQWKFVCVYREIYRLAFLDSWIEIHRSNIKDNLSSPLDSRSVSDFE